MKLFFNAFALIGRLAYTFASPFIRIWLKHSHRAYIIMVCGVEVLVIKNWFGVQQWHLPGGGVGKHESVTEAVCREVSEELGIELDPANIKDLSEGVWHTNQLGYPYKILQTSLTQKPSFKLKRPEILSASWTEPDYLNTQNTPAEILNALSALEGQNKP